MRKRRVKRPLRVSSDLHDKMERIAADEGRSLAYLTAALWSSGRVNANWHPRKRLNVNLLPPAIRPPVASETRLAAPRRPGLILNRWSCVEL
jgi:hypothetical protein